MGQTSVVIPEVKEILNTGLQFGHSHSRWNPKMAKYIFGEKNGIHIIDVIQTREALAAAAEFLQQVASRGEIIFVGTKKQAVPFVQAEALRAGAHFVINRWPGGLLTNFSIVGRSVTRLRSLETMFEEGVEGRTKYEVTRMKMEWFRLNRLYGGCKQMQKLPVAAVVIDPKFEHVAVRECRKMSISVVALTDTNCDPTSVDYLIPGNDDALKAIELVLKVLADAILLGNEGKGVEHNLKDYMVEEVKLVKTEELSSEEVLGENLLAAEGPVVEEEAKTVKVSSPRRKGSKAESTKGILEAVKDRADAKAAAERRAAKTPKTTKKTTK